MPTYVTTIEDLMLEGSRAGARVGTHVKNIRLVEGDHDIDRTVGESWNGCW